MHTRFYAIEYDDFLGNLNYVSDQFFHGFLYTKLFIYLVTIYCEED